MIKFRRASFRLLTPPHCPRWVWDEVADAAATGCWEPGPRVAKLEKTIARILRVEPEQVFATASCTAALAAATYFAEWPTNDEGEPRIRVCPLTYRATWTFARNFGIKVDFVDCDEFGWPVGPVDIGVELWGRPFPFDIGTPRILDAAHRALSPYHGAMANDADCAVCYSFNCQKELAAFHGGALVLPKDWATREEVQAFLHCGTTNRRPHLQGCGIKGYLQDPLAAQVQGQIRRLGAIRMKRRTILENYQYLLGQKWLMTLPSTACGSLCVLRFPSEGERDLVRRALTKNHVDTSIHYEVPEEFGCPGATELSRRILTLPCHMYLTRNDVRRICRIVVNA